MYMQLLIKQRVFSWTDKYDIYDEEGNMLVLAIDAANCTGLTQ